MSTEKDPNGSPKIEGRRLGLLSRYSLAGNVGLAALKPKNIWILALLFGYSLLPSRAPAQEELSYSLTVVNPDTASGATKANIEVTEWDWSNSTWVVVLSIEQDDGQYIITGGINQGKPTPDTEQGATWGSFLGAAYGYNLVASGIFQPGTSANFTVFNTGRGQLITPFTLPPSILSGYYPTVSQSRLVVGGEPVQLATGSEVRHKRLFNFSGARNWDFELTYNSLLARYQSSFAPMSIGWSHNFQAQIYPLGSNLIMAWDQGRRNTFTPVTGNSGHFASTDDATRYDTIVAQSGGGWVLTHKDQSSLVFNSSGLLITDIDSHGRILNLGYSSGILTSITDPISNTSLALTYNANDMLQGLTDSTGATVQLNYQMLGGEWMLTDITDQNGKNWTYNYDSGDQLTSVADNNGNLIISNTNNSQGQVTAQADGQSHQSTFAYATVGGVPTTTFTDRNGHAEVDTFDSNYNELSTTDALSEKTVYTYDSLNRVTSVTDPLNRTTTYTYDSEGNVLTVTDPANKVTTYAYDSHNNLLTVTDPLNHVTTRTYDSNNNLLTYKDALGNTTTWTYNSNSQPITKTLPRGGAFAYAYTAGKLTQVTDPNGIVTTYSYDGDGRLLAATDALGNVTTYTYDAVGNRLTAKNPLNQIFTYAYDIRNRTTSVTEPTGAVTVYTYDNNGNLLSATDALSHLTTYAYTPEDQLQTVTDALSRVTTLAYDNVDRLISVTDPANNVTSSAYDAAGQVTSTVDALGKSTTFAHELRGLLTGVTDPLNRSTTFSYDAKGRKITSLDPLSRQTNFTYDAANRLTQLTDPGSLVTAQAYDTDSNPSSLTSPAANATTFTHDMGDRLTASTTPAGRVTGYSYDARGLPFTVTQPSGHTTTFAYDTAKRMSSFTDPVATVSVTRDADGRALTISESGNTLTRVYDAAGRLTSYTDGAGNVMGYQYDALNRLTVLTYPGGKQVSYAYDTAGRLSTVTDWASRVTTYSYDSDGRMTQLLRPNGTKQVRTYDAAGQLTQITDYAPNGTTVIYSASYGYDLAGQLTTASVSPATTGVTPNVTQTVDQDDRLLTQNGSAVTLDSDGNLLSIASGVTPATYSYDARNRLTSAGGLTYGYNSENRRVSLTDSTGTTQFAINPNAALDQVLVRTVPNGTQTFYVYGLGLLHEDTGGAARFYHFDQRGDTVALTGDTGVSTGTVAYGAYGEILNQTGLTDTPFLFNGAWGVQTDSNGLHFQRARYYQPSLRRWLNIDPLGVSGGLNIYGYVSNNPLNEIDPLGLIELQLYFGLSGTLGSMFGVSPGPFGHGEANVGIAIDLSNPINGSRYFANKQVAPMAGIGIAGLGGPQIGITVTREPIPAGKSVEITFHGEGGASDISGIGGAVDANGNGIGGSRIVDEYGVGIYGAGGIAQTTTYGSPSIGEISQRIADWIEGLAGDPPKSHCPH